ncbi:MAG: site-2 protease family protein [Nitrospiraceae bacterium]|nr:MAG: site-2 protease family protein [Nitrospiraceae bacterium]
MSTDTIRELIIAAPPLLMAITFHELSHGFIANKLGDPTAKMMGRLTINPVAHIDPIGTVIMPLILLATGAPVFGYAKPVPINPANFRDPKKHMAISAAAGPLSNVLLAILSVLFLKLMMLPISLLPANIGAAIIEPMTLMVIFSIRINIFLAAFNLIPIPPLDGGRVFVGFLPHRQAAAYSRIEPYGFIIVLALIFTGIAGYFVFPLANFFSALVRLF